MVGTDYGGFYREGTTMGRAEICAKSVVQMEGLNALLLMHEKYGSVDGRVLQRFQHQWRFIKDRQVDHEFGGLYDTVERDGTPTDHTKARIWKRGLSRRAGAVECDCTVAEAREGCEVSSRFSNRCHHEVSTDYAVAGGSCSEKSIFPYII